MKWVFILGGVERQALWENDEFSTNAIELAAAVTQVVNSKTIVACGLLGPYLEASVKDGDIRAWGTIVEGFVFLDEVMKNAPSEMLEVAGCPVFPELDNEEPFGSRFMEKVARLIPKYRAPEGSAS